MRFVLRISAAHFLDAHKLMHVVVSTQATRILVRVSNMYRTLFTRRWTHVMPERRRNTLRATARMWLSYLKDSMRADDVQTDAPAKLMRGCPRREHFRPILIMPIMLYIKNLKLKTKNNSC